MKFAASYNRLLIVLTITVFTFNALRAEVNPAISCTATSISPSELDCGPGAGQLYPSVTVTTPGNCTNYTITNSYSWISYSKSGLTVTITVQANTGPARYGSINIGGQSLLVYQDCGNYPGAAGLITGSSTVCQNQNGVSYSVAAISRATGYTWTLPSGATIASGNNTNTITVNFSSSATSGNISVIGTNSCGSGTHSPNFPVTVNTAPVQPGAISGTTTVCSGSTYTYSISPVTGASSYSWTLPSGATGSSTTTSINVTFGSNPGYITVAAISSLGCIGASRNLAISISSLVKYNVTGGTNTICPSSYVPIGLDGSTSGIVYKCYLNGGFQVPPVTGTGNSISFGNKNYGGTYTVTGVSSAGCEIPMNGSASITVRTPSTPASSINATLSVVCPGQATTLSVVGGSLEPSYGVWKWYSGGCGTTYLGQGSSISVSPTNTTTYYVRAEGGCLTTTCTSITITVKQAPSITLQPSNTTISLGQDASFTTSATGSNVQYQWQIASSSNGPWTNLTGPPAVGFQTATLTITGSSTFSDSYYRCAITADCYPQIFTNAAKIILSFALNSYLTGSNIPNPETRTLNTSYKVGTLPGHLEIDQLGGSTYTVQIDLPKGVNDLSPVLSMVYSSNAGPGIAGYGWQIGGLSEISRGPETVYNDGVARGIEMDSNDRFYLDGQRLVNTCSTYGASDALYQTENDIFTRVTPQKTDSNGPAWFRAETKSGLIYEYGHAEGSALRINGYSQVLNWYVSKISDLFGNQVLFTYLQNNHTVYPSEINYGPNKIKFVYLTRSDQTFSFIKGTKIEQDLILNKIIISYNSNVITTYQFNQSYKGSSYNSYSILNEIIESGLNSDQFNSTAISYQIPSNVSYGQTLYNTTHQYVTYNSIMVTGDFNGDGKSDFFCLPNSANGATWTGMRVCLGDGNDNFSSIITSSTSLDLNRLRDIRALDLNADGIDDIVYEYGDSPSSSTSTYYYIICNGSSLSQPVPIYQGSSGAHIGLTGKSRRTTDRQEDDNERVSNRRTEPSVYTHPIPKCSVDADYNGDGVNDIFINYSNGFWQIFSLVDQNGNLSSNMNLIGSGTISTLNGDVLSGDFNGDGKSDIWSFTDSGVSIYTLVNGSLSILYTSNWPTKGHYFNLGDFNGDGKIDMFLYGYGKGQGTQYDWGTWQMWLSTGTGFEEHDITQKKTNLYQDYIRIGDFNGDGSADLMITSSDNSWQGTYFYISSNFGAGLLTENLPSYPISSHNYYLADYDGDGRMDFICTDGVSPWWTGYQVYRSPGKTTTLFEKISNGLGVLQKVSYKKMSQASSTVYQKGNSATFPVFAFQGQWNIVDSVRSDNGLGTQNVSLYYYEGAKMHLKGKGFLGYSKTSITDISTAIESDNVFSYENTYFSPTKVISSSVRAGTTDTIGVVTNIWSKVILDATNKRIFPYIQSSTQLDKLTGLSVTTSTKYDNYGNDTLIVKSYSGGSTETTKNTFNNTVSSTQWLLGRPTSILIQYISSGNQAITRSGTRIFDTNTNHLQSETSLPGTNQQIIKSYVYNANGTLQSETATASGMSRTRSFIYESDNIRTHSITDIFSHVTLNTYDNYGRLHTQQDYLGNTATYDYDNLNRQSSTSSTDGNQTSTQYQWEDPTSSPAYARYSLLKTCNDGTQTKTWYDKLGRVIQTDVKGFNGSMIYTSTTFNEKGQVQSISEPYYSTDTPQLNSYIYDCYGRKTSVTRPSGRNSSWSYNLNTIIETTASKSFSKTYNSNGTISTASDPGGTITYSYYPDGKLKSILSPGGVTTKLQYDIAGNQDTLIDASAGAISYSYNGFGELTTQVLPNGNSTSITYLSDGRISQKTTLEGITKYRYNSNKQIVNINSPQNVSRTFGYDSKGRIISVIDSIPGSNPFTTSTTYDALGRKSSITHPSGITETYNYNSNGYLNTISAGGKTRWAITGISARGQVTSGTFNNNLTGTFGYDSYGFPTSISAGSIQNCSYNFNPITGNLNWRQNNVYAGLREDFKYDNLDRLVNVIKNTDTTLKMSYDGNTGAIINKSDAGTYAYESQKNPYAITKVQPTTGLVPSNSQNITYTSFNSVNSITENNYEADFLYNSDNSRAQMIVKQNGSLFLTRWYPTSSYIKELSNSISKEYTFIGGDAYTANAVAIKQNGTTSYYSILRDYLGSITHVVDSNGIVIAEYSYDAWGRMRNPSTWVNNAPGSDPQLILGGRGYTGHEHLSWFNTINMNGRLYDPLIGIFLSPDPHFQAIGNSVGFDKYSYCMNNPLRYTDPSGFNWLTSLGHWIGKNWKSIVTTALTVTAAVVVGVCTAGLGVVVAGALAGAAAGLTSGVVGTALNGGNLGQCLSAGFIGALKGGIIGAAGGVAASFAPVGALWGTLYGSGTGAMLGGASSVMNGGSFWQGAAIGFVTGGIIGGIKGYMSAQEQVSQLNSEGTTLSDEDAVESNPYSQENTVQSSTYSDEDELGLTTQLSHYATDDPNGWTSIGKAEWEDNRIWFTPNSELSSSEAVDQLALDKTPNWRIDINTTDPNFDPSKVMLIQRVASRTLSDGTILHGGEIEVIYKGPLDITSGNIVVKIAKLGH